MTRHPLWLLLILASACGEKTGPGPGTVDAPIVADAPRPPDAPPLPPVDAAPQGVVCAMKDPVVQIGFTCHIVWSQCTDQSTYDLSCRIQNVAGNVFSLCDCTQDGVAGAQFISTTVCGSTEFSQVEAVVNDKCGWDVH
jgi:hypothetical protein